MTYSGRESRTCISGIGVNAAGVAGVATPNILTIVLFFPFSGTWNGFTSLYRSLGTNWYFYKVYHTTTIHGTHES